jgi:hypothetical protein
VNIFFIDITDFKVGEYIADLLTLKIVDFFGCSVHW